MSVFDKLKQVADHQPKEKKSSAKEIADPAIGLACENFVKASRDQKNAEAVLKQAQAEVLDYIKPIHSQEIEAGDPTKTYRLNGTVMCMFTDRFGALKDHEISLVKEKLQEAEVPFEKLFKERVKLKLKDSVADNSKELEKLIESLGDLLPRYFEVGVETLPVDDFDKALARENIYGKIGDIVERIRWKPTLKVT